jgi:hypothetical protein
VRTPVVRPANTDRSCWLPTVPPPPLATGTARWACAPATQVVLPIEAHMAHAQMRPHAKRRLQLDAPSTCLGKVHCLPRFAHGRRHRVPDVTGADLTSTDLEDASCPVLLRLQACFACLDIPMVLQVHLPAHKHRQ